MEPGWSEIVRTVGWRFFEDKDPLAFAYIAKVSVEVEDATVALSPALPRHELRKVMSQRPEWLRPDWLKPDWPAQVAESETELLVFGLTAAKALLAVGALIPDGSLLEMQQEFERMFPGIAAATGESHNRFQCWSACVTIARSGRMQWGLDGLARDGLPMALGNEIFGDRSAFEIYLQNAMRLDIQRRLETKPSGTHPAR